MLSILTINYEYPPIGGGGGVICKDIAEELVQLGHKVIVLTSQFGDLAKEETINGVKIYRTPTLFRTAKDTATLISMVSYVPSGIFSALKLSNNSEFDLVHTHFAIPSGPVGHYLAKKFQVPNILSIHGGDIFDPSKSLSPHKTPILKQTVKAMLKNATRVVAQSTDTRNNAKMYYGIERTIDIIPLGIKELKSPDQNYQKPAEISQKLVFTTIGRVVRRKNIENLLEVMRKIKQEIPVILYIIGDGPERENIQNKIETWKLQDSVKVVGRISDEDKLYYLSISDVFVSTAMHEGFGIVFLEAMEFGLPVVCYDRGGQKDFLKNGKTGFLVQLNNTDSFISRIREISKDASLRKKMGDYNKQYVKEFYIKNIAQKYADLFYQALG